MKYRSTTPVAAQVYTPPLPTGINLECALPITDPSRLTDCMNIQWENGILRTRPGISCGETELAQMTDDEYCEKPLTFTDTPVNIDGVFYRIAYLLLSDGSSYQRFCIFLISETGDIRSIGSLRFSRTDILTFFTASRLLFFQGKATSGSGIYAFAERYCKGDYSYSVFEADTSLENWNNVTDFYCPTVYINGRGTRYSEASAAGTAYNVSPESPERPNLLTGRFKCCYSSDGFSSVFRLPASNLDDANVTCRVYFSPDNYTEWIIEAGKNSVSATVGSESLIMNCDRKYGLVYFNDQNGAYSLPASPQYGANNIMITAYKTNSSGMQRIIGCQKCTVSSARVFLYGNTHYPSEIYCARLDNPLYFPDSSFTAVGDISEETTGLIETGSHLTVFKKNSIYRLKLKEGSKYVPDIPVGETEADFDGLFTADTLTCSALNSGIGCDCRETLRHCDGFAVWLKSGGDVYMLKDSDSDVTCISPQISSALKKFDANAQSDAFAVDRDGRYYLFLSGREIFVLDYRQQDLSRKITDSKCRAWYKWELPEGVSISSAVSIDRILLGCQNTGGVLHYTAEFSGDTDRILAPTDDGFEVQEAKISAHLSTARYDFSAPQALKSIDSITLSFFCNGSLNVVCEGESSCTISLTGADGGAIKTARIAPNLRRCEGLMLTLSSDSTFGLAGISIRFRKHPSVRWAAT